MSAAVPAGLSSFAAFDEATGVMSFTAITDETQYGYHVIPVSAETVNAVSFGTATNLAVWLSKPACEAPLFKLTTTSPSATPTDVSCGTDNCALTLSSFVTADAAGE